MFSSLHRRRFLELGLKTAAGAALAQGVSGCGPGFPSSMPVPVPHPLAAGLPEVVDVALFPFGVQAGGVDEGSVLLWSVSDPRRDLTLWLWMRDGLVVRQTPLRTDDDGYARIAPDGLPSGTELFYAFVDDETGARSEVGRFRTAFAPDEERALSVACTTCTNWSTQPWSTLERAASFDFDLILHLGDMVYADGAFTADAYRDTWRRALDDDGYRRLLPRAAMYHVWDDHEFWNNLDPEASPERVAIARAAFFQNSPQREGENGRLWRSYQWGRTAEFILLDARTERRPSTLGDDDVYMSEDQLAFLSDRLRSSPARFKVVMNSLPLTRMPDLYPMPEDRWQGYRRQRDALLSVLEDDDAARGTLFLSGDFHIGFIARAEREGVHRRLHEIAVGPGGSYGNPFGEGPLRDLGLPGDQFSFVTGRLSSTFLRFEPETGEVVVRFVDGENGTTLVETRIRPGE